MVSNINGKVVNLMQDLVHLSIVIWPNLVNLFVDPGNWIKCTSNWDIWDHFSKVGPILHILVKYHPVYY